MFEEIVENKQGIKVSTFYMGAYQIKWST